jgi:hypothetical protein
LPSGVNDRAGSDRLEIRLTSATGSLPVRFEVPARFAIGTYSIVDPQGRAVWSAPLTAGGTATWSGMTRQGVRAAAGVYFLKVQVGARRSAAPVVLLD